jgi:octaprenyl-diphosphate synthase
MIEFIHTATLLHDDVVDESDMRRGRETANALFGNAASVLVGDFLYTRAFQMMVTTNNMQILQVMAEATNIIAEGEVLQLLNIGNTELSEQDYLQVIQYKTAKLFEAAARVGALIAGGSEAQIKALADYGMYLGTAFQIIDDVLDYSGDADTIGKSLGDDLAEGKATLPLIYTMRQGPPPLPTWCARHWKTPAATVSTMYWLRYNPAARWTTPKTKPSRPPNKPWPPLPICRTPR